MSFVPFLSFASCPSKVKKHQDRVLLRLLLSCAPGATLDFSPAHRYRLRISKFVAALLGYRSVDVVWTPMFRLPLGELRP
jgi:hypothetical protein